MATQTKSQPSPQEIVESLLPYSACDVSDALVKLGHASDGFIAGPTLWSPERQSGSTKIIGPAYTVEYVKLDQATAATPSGHYIDSVPPGSVIVISAPQDVKNCVFGGLMATRAKYRQAVGTVVDGNVRDIEDHRSMQYPIFARELGAASPYGAVRVNKIDGPVKMGSDGHKILVRPGDFIVGDANGVVCVPMELLEQLLQAMEISTSADAKMADDLKRGMSFQEASRKHRAK